MGGPGETYREVILRLVGIEGACAQLASIDRLTRSGRVGWRRLAARPGTALKLPGLRHPTLPPGSVAYEPEGTASGKAFGAVKLSTLRGLIAPGRPLKQKPRVVLRIGLSYTSGQRG